MNTKTILFTGGHLTPAIATIEELRDREVPVRMVFIGRSNATEHVHDISHEKESMRQLGIPFYAITTGRIQRFFSYHSIVSFLKIPIGFFQALSICIKERPDCIVSFGGYVALPVVISGWILGIPSVTHEQTSVMGLANRIIAKFAKKICVTFPGMLQDIPKTKGIYTGLPIRKNIRTIKRKELKKTDTADTTIYITGGSTGAASVNNLIFPILPALTKKYRVLHQTGRLSFPAASSHKAALPDTLRDRYIVYDYVPSEELVNIFKKITLVVGRSGANTTIEIATLGIPALFIPLPWSGGGEQVKNARWLESKGSAVVPLQSEATPERVLSAIDEMILHKSDYQRHAVHCASSMPHDGSLRFVDTVMTQL